MYRRQMLSLVAAGAVALLAATKARAKAATFHALKGVCCNDLASLAAVNLEWFHIQWGPWCFDQTHTYRVDWTIHLYDSIPLLSELQQAVMHPNYSGWWMCGTNEPDLAGLAPQAYAALVAQQIQLVQQADPQAQFAVECGTFLNPLYEDNSWFQQMWTYVPQNLKPAIRAFHSHLYPNADLTPNAYFRECMAWLNDKFPRREFWITEIGLPLNSVAQYGTQYSPANIQSKCDKWGVDRWAWYCLSDITVSGYATLTANSHALLTPTGVLFNNA